MKKLLGLLAVGLLVLVMAGPAAAAYSYNFDLGGGSYFSGSALSDPGLKMWATTNPGLDSVSFSLTSGSTWTGNFGMIGTKEGWINDDDLVPQEITAWVEFDDPSLTAAIGGSSVGFKGVVNFVNFYQGWSVTWLDPVEIYFGNGNYLTLDLEDAYFVDYAFLGIGLSPAGCDKINLTVGYNHVPVPAAVWLLGSGLVGLAGLRRKFRA